MELHQCTWPNCAHYCNVDETTPPCRAEHENKVAELQRQVGAEMIKMTTTVWHMDEWLAIPFIWQEVATERDRLQAQVSALKAELDAVRGNWK